MFVDLKLDTGSFDRTLKSTLAAAAKNKVTIKVDADTASADAKLIATRKLADAVGAASPNVKVKADKSQLTKISSGLDGLVSKLGTIPALAIAATAALGPVAVAAGGVAAALAGPAVAGVGGVGIFAIVGSQMAKQANEAKKNLDKLHAAVLSATPGKDRTAALKAYSDALKAMTPQQEGFLRGEQSLKDAFDKLTSGPAGVAVLGTMAKGLDDLAKVLPVATPWLTSVSGAFDDLMNQFMRFTHTNTFKSLNQFFSKEAGTSIRIFGSDHRPLALDFAKLLRAWTPEGNKLLRQFAHAIDGWNPNKSKQVHDFMRYVHQVGPQVASTLGSVAKAIGRMVRALAPLGPPALKAVKGIADAISSIPTDTLTKLTEAFLALVAFQKLGGFKGIGLLGKGISAFKSGGVKGVVSNITGVAGQRVFVTNWPPGLLVPGGGGLPGKAGKVLTTEEEVAAAAAAEKASPGIIKRVLGKVGLGGLAEKAGGGGLARLLGFGLEAPALMTMGDMGNEVLPAPRPITTVKGAGAQTLFPDVKTTGWADLDKKLTHMVQSGHLSKVEAFFQKANEFGSAIEGHNALGDLQKQLPNTTAKINKANASMHATTDHMVALKT